MKVNPESEPFRNFSKKNVVAQGIFLKSFQTVTADIDVEELSISSIVTFPKTTHRPHLVTNGFKEENQEDTKVVLKLDRVKGRLNIAVLTRERIAISKFDG